MERARPEKYMEQFMFHIKGHNDSLLSKISEIDMYNNLSVPAIIDYLWEKN
jgi:hypothetical protein